MAVIWANRLIAGTKIWGDVPLARRPAVLSELQARVASEAITADQYEDITGIPYEA